MSALEADMTYAETVTMSAKELDRLEVLGRVVERRLTQRQAAEPLGLSERQVRRLCRALCQQGAAGLVSRMHAPMHRLRAEPRGDRRPSSREPDISTWRNAGHF